MAVEPDLPLEGHPRALMLAVDQPSEAGTEGEPATLEQECTRDLASDGVEEVQREPNEGTLARVVVADDQGEGAQAQVDAFGAEALVVLRPQKGQVRPCGHRGLRWVGRTGVLSRIRSGEGYSWPHWSRRVWRGVSGVRAAHLRPFTAMSSGAGRHAPAAIRACRRLPGEARTSGRHRRGRSGAAVADPYGSVCPATPAAATVGSSVTLSAENPPSFQ